MRKRSRRQLGWSAAGALAAALGAPSLAEAQQSGLFPLHPIKRERVPCPNEDPIYKMYRHEFFGYHPTCWRKFPAGWGCPSPEAPNAAKSFQDIPRVKPEAIDAGGDQGGAEPGAAMPGDDAAAPGDASPNARPAPGSGGNIPPLPSNDRSPFDLDTKPNATPTPTPTPRTGEPNANPARPSGAAPATRPGTVEVPGVSDLDLPARGITPPASAAPAPATSPSADSGPTPATSPSADASPAPAAGGETQADATGTSPLLALPDPTVNPSSASRTTFPATPPPVVNNAGRVQAPRRTSVIGSLFSGRLFRRQ